MSDFISFEEIQRQVQQLEDNFTLKDDYTEELKQLFDLADELQFHYRYLNAQFGQFLGTARQIEKIRNMILEQNKINHELTNNF